jgi:hypothetical protein
VQQPSSPAAQQPSSPAAPSGPLHRRSVAPSSLHRCSRCSTNLQLINNPIEGRFLVTSRVCIKVTAERQSSLAVALPCGSIQVGKLAGRWTVRRRAVHCLILIVTRRPPDCPSNPRSYTKRVSSQVFNVAGLGTHTCRPAHPHLQHPHPHPFATQALTCVRRPSPGRR